MRFSFYLLQKILHALVGWRMRHECPPNLSNTFVVGGKTAVGGQNAHPTRLRSGQPTKRYTSVGRRLPRQKMLATRHSQRGFTLIEIIIGIVVLSISMAIVGSLINPAEQQSADQIQQIKAAELGQGMLDEILGRAFDDKSDMAGGRVRCGESTIICTTILGPETGENNRKQYDDVDDYNGFTVKKNSTNNNLDASFNSFQIKVTVIYAGSELGLSNNNLAKRITVTVTTPLGTAIDFTGYKANF